MPEIVDIPLADLLLDVKNARLKDEQASQQAAILALAVQQGKRLLKIATDIVEHGTDPISLVAVIPTPDQRKRYIVIEGNRRVASLKALDTPTLVAAAFSPQDQKVLQKLAGQFAKKPITEVKCVLFDSEEELGHWVTLRHTGQNEGVGLVEWGSDEKDRWGSRHTGAERSPAGQIIDFVEQTGLLSDAAKASKKGIITSVGRVLISKEVRDRLGITVQNGQVETRLPVSEVAKGLVHLVEGFKTGTITVKDIYHAPDRKRFAESLPSEALPNLEAARSSSRPLSEVADDPELVTLKKSTNRKKKKAVSVTRTSLIPRDCTLDINPPRINLVYNELLSLSADLHPNACSVLLRVFVELSVDHYIESAELMTEAQRRNTPLAKRLKEVAAKLREEGAISSQLEIAIIKVADSQHALAASMVNFNQYVHNKYVFPKASELRLAWDELQPFMQKLWPEQATGGN